MEQLVDQGYLSRIDVPGDRRKVELVLNKKANDVIKKRKSVSKPFSFLHFFQILMKSIKRYLKKH